MPAQSTMVSRVMTGIDIGSDTFFQVARNCEYTEKTEQAIHEGYIKINVAFNVVSQLEVDPDSLYFADAPAFLDMLAVLRDAGVDLCAEDEFGKTLGARMAAKDLIADDELPDCS